MFPEPIDRDDPAADFDPAAFAKLEALFPPDRLARHLDRFDAQLGELLALDDPTELKHHAHKLVAQAGLLGFMRLSHLCRALEEALDEGRPAAQPLAEVRSAAAAARAQLAGVAE